MIKRFALTGGPGGGKSRALARLKKCEEISRLGWNVATTPESASIIIPCGFDPVDLLTNHSRDKYCKFQEQVFNIHLFLENSVAETAKHIKGKPLLLISDRGIPDIKCYNTEEEYLQLLKSRSESAIGMRDGRYGAAFHMSTIADTDPDLYIKIYKENEVRYEDTPEKAIAADLKTRNAWLGHPHFRVIPNKTSDGKILGFDEKLDLLLRHILHIIAENSLEIEKKYLVYEPVDITKFPVPFAKVEMEQIYLSAKVRKERIRRRTQGGHSLYYRGGAKKATAIPGARLEPKEYLISKGEYQYLSQFADSKRRPIRKERIYFLHENQYFELDIMQEPEQIMEIAFLEIELLDANESVILPEWLGKCEDVTGKKQYSMRSLAKK